MYGECINYIFLQGSKEKIKEHEKAAVGTHMLLLLQYIKQLKANLCTVSKAANGFISQTELNVNGAEKSISELCIPGSLKVNGDLEVDCLTRTSVPRDESTVQQLVREKVISELENKLHVFENIVAVLNKEVETSNLEITAFRRQSELDQNVIRGLELKVSIYGQHWICACCIDNKYLPISERGAVEMGMEMSTSTEAVQGCVLDTPIGSFSCFECPFKWASLIFVL